MDELYVVVVEHNLVRAIERAAAGAAPARVPATPLEVSTELAGNYRDNGCLDGRYYFTQTQAAKIFAGLCLEFIQALAQRRLAAINALPVGSAAYRADEDDGSRGRATGGG